MKRFVLLLLCCQLTALALAGETRTVIIAVIDGARYTETFGDSTHQYIPRIWTALRPQGVIYTAFRNDGETETNPGHSSIVTGTWQSVPNDGTVRPNAPTIFEYYRKALGSPMSESYVVLGKEKLDILSYSMHPEYGIAHGASVKYSTSDYDDRVTFDNVKSVLQADHPRLLIANFAATDRQAHNGSWGGYVDGIRTADSLIYEIWNFAQQDSVLKGKTTLIVTNDHGRHLTDWMNHGDVCEGCRRIMLLIAGPDTPVGQVDSLVSRQIDIAPTVGMLLGFPTPYVLGKAIPSALTIPRYHLLTSAVGSGSVVRTPADSLLWEGTKVLLRADAALGSRFVAWTGALSGSRNPDSLIIDGNKTVGATFELLPQGQFELRASVTGDGTIELDPPGPYYAGGTEVVATAHPGPGAILGAWSGAASGDSGSVRVVVDTHQFLSASFRPMLVNQLSLRAIGQGSVSVSPEGGAYPETTIVTISATPAPGWELAEWTGSANGTANPCMIAMKHSSEAKARFRKIGDRVWSLQPTHDSFVRGSLYASNNYGNDSSLYVQEGMSDASRRRSFLQFDLASVTGRVTSAALLLRTRKAGLPDGVPARVFAQQSQSDEWAEGTLTWRNMPQEGTLLDSTVGVTGTELRYAWDVTDFVTAEQAGDRVVSILLRDRTGMSKTVVFGSGESDVPPILEIQTSEADAIGEDPDLPRHFALEQNYPNPFNPKTGVSSQYPVASQVKLAVYDLLGREVKVPVNEWREAGRYRDTFDGSGLASGLYYYRLRAVPAVGGTPFISTRTMLLVR